MSKNARFMCHSFGVNFSEQDKFFLTEKKDKKFCSTDSLTKCVKLLVQTHYSTYKLRLEKTCFLHVRNQRCRSAPLFSYKDSTIPLLP